MYRVSTCVNGHILRSPIYQKDWCMGNGSFWMSEHSRYQYLINEAPHNVGDFLNNALAGLKTVNTSIKAYWSASTSPDRTEQNPRHIKQRQLIAHFDLHRRREFPESVGKKGGEFNIMVPTKLWSQCHLKIAL